MVKDQDYKKVKLWNRGRTVRALSLVSKDSEFNPSKNCYSLLILSRQNLHAVRITRPVKIS